MKIRHIYMVFLMVAILTAGCEKTIKFRGEIMNPMLVVSSFVTPDSAIKAVLTESRFFLDEGSGGYGGYEYNKVTNADFSLYVNNTFKEKLTHTGAGIYRAAYRPKPGEEIRIEAVASGFESVKATTVIPPQPVILSVDTSSVTEKQYYIGYTGEYNGSNRQDTLSEYTYKNIRFRVKLRDDGNKKNYYRLVVRKRTYYENEVNESYLFDFEDIVFGNQQTNDIGSLFEFSDNNYFFDTFTDDLFNGKEYDLKFSNSIRISQKDYKGYDSQFRKEMRSTYYIYLQEISHDYYMYARSSAAAGNQSGNPFTEPVQIYTNIANGIGIFGSYASSAPAVIDYRNE